MSPLGTYSEGTAGCGTEVVWLAVWMENDHYVNSHLEAGENLPLGHCSSYPWLPRAFPSTPLTSKSLWQSSQPTSMAAVTGRGLWEPHCGCVIHQPPRPPPASTTQWLITHVIGSVTNQPGIQELHRQDRANDTNAPPGDVLLTCRNVNTETKCSFVRFSKINPQSWNI